VTSQAEWITISFGETGTGNGSAGYAVRQNLTPFPRTGTILVATRTFTVNQAAAVCNFQFNLSRSRFPSEGAGGTLTINTPCSWEVTTDADWIVFGGSRTGTGNGSLAFTVGANPAATERIGRISVSGQTLVITQSAAGCSFTLTPAVANIGAEGGTGSVEVTSPLGCAWTATANVPWITINPGAAGASPVSYTVAANRTPEARVGMITVADVQLVITQAGAMCNLILTPPNAAFAAAAGQGSFTVATTCEWRTTTQDSWIAVTSGGTGSGNGTVNYTVAANTSNQARNGNINVSGRGFAVSQQGAACSYTISPLGAAIDGAGGNGSIGVTATSTDCNWDATSNANWIRVQAVSRGGTSGTVSYAALPNPDSAPRTGTILVAGQTFTVTQAAAGPQITAAGIVNAASFQPGPLAPGEIVTLFGLHLGPANLATLELTSDGQSLTKTLSGTRVLFDDEAAPMVFSAAGQVSAIVPYATAGRESTRVQVEFEGRRSNAVPMAMAAAAPAIFTRSATGSGPGAILNEDFQVNSAANPAAAGSIIMIFATGEGETEPAGVDGRLTGSALARPKLPVKVFIGDAEAGVLYAGSAPGLVAGVIQINARIPLGTAAGEASVRFGVGELSSQDGVTVAVR